MWDNFTFEEVLESLEELYEEWDFESTYDEFILQQFEMFENSDSVDLFLDLYNDTNRNNYLRCHAALMLGRIGDKRVFEDLIKIVENKNENSHFRIVSIDGLLMLGDRRALERLVMIAKNRRESNSIREEAIRFFGKVRDDSIIECLKSILKDTSENNSLIFEVMQVLEDYGVDASAILRERKKHLKILFQNLTSGKISPSEFKSQIKQESSNEMITYFFNSIPKFKPDLRRYITLAFGLYFFDDIKTKHEMKINPDTNRFYELTKQEHFWGLIENFHDNLYSRRMSVNDVVKYFRNQPHEINIKIHYENEQDENDEEPGSPITVDKDFPPDPPATLPRKLK